jgi:hypothetical protein
MRVKPLKHDIVKNFFEKICWGMGLKHDLAEFSQKSFDILKRICKKKGITVSFIYDCVLYDEHDSDHEEVHNAFEFDCDDGSALVLKITGELYYHEHGDATHREPVAKLW